MSDTMKRLMQESLDGHLNPQTLTELYEYLDQDPEAAREYARLEMVDHLLTTASSVRAPGRLAATIMARLAESLEAEAELHDMPEEIRQALMLSFSLVMVAMMPMMMAASYLVVNALADPEVLNRVLERTIALLVVLIDALVILLEEIEAMVHDDPQMATVAMALIPMTLLSILDYIEYDQARSSPEA